jgi:hypothetical protein
MTKATLRTRVMTDFGFDIAAASVDDVIFERYSALVVESRFREALVALDTTVAGQGAYDLPAEYANVHAVLIGTAEYERTGPVTIMGLKSGRLGWRFTPGSGGFFAPAFSATGVAQVELFPAPETTGDTITALVATEPPAFSGDSDVPILPSHLHKYIAYGAIAELLALDEERMQEADRFEGMYQAGILAVTRYKNRRVGSGSGQIKVTGYHR